MAGVADWPGSWTAWLRRCAARALERTRVSSSCLLPLHPFCADHHGRAGAGECGGDDLAPRSEDAGRPPGDPRPGDRSGQAVLQGRVAPPRAQDTSGRVSEGNTHTHTHTHTHGEVPGQSQRRWSAIPVVQALPSRVPYPPPAFPISNSQADSTCLCFSVLADRLVGEARVLREALSLVRKVHFLLISCCVAAGSR